MKKQKVKEFIKTHKMELIITGIGTCLAVFCGVKTINNLKSIKDEGNDILKCLSEGISDHSVMVFEGCDQKDLNKTIASLVLDSSVDISEIGKVIHFCDDDGVNFTVEIVQFM